MELRHRTAALKHGLPPVGRSGATRRRNTRQKAAPARRSPFESGSNRSCRQCPFVSNPDERTLTAPFSCRIFFLIPSKKSSKLTSRRPKGECFELFETGNVAMRVG